MEANSQSSTGAQRSEAIVTDRRFGERSDTVRKNISRGVKRYMRRSPGEVSALHAKLRDKRLGKPRLDLRGRTGPTPAKSQGTPSWEFVKLRASGASLPATAKKCEMKLSGVHCRIQALGLPRHCSLYDFEPFVGKHARYLSRVSGFTYSEFAGQLGISPRSMQADVSPKHVGMHVDPERARKYLAWRDRVVRVLLAEAPGEKGNRVRWGKSSVLKTFFPDLRARRRLLVETLPRIGAYLCTHPQAEANELGEWVCDQAQAETKRDPRTMCWRKLLPWLPKLMPTLMRNLDLLRLTPEHNGATALLADHFGVSSSTLQRALERKTCPISPERLRTLVILGTKTAEITQLKVKAEKFPHRPPEDKRAARVYQLRKQRLPWKVVHARIVQEFRIHTTLDALQMLVKRYFKRQKAA